MNAVMVPVYRARSPWARLRGLLSSTPLPSGCGLLLEHCKAIHTLGMRRAIDVVFLTADGVVVKMHRGLGAGRLAWCPRASRVLELAAGDAWRLGLWTGCRVLFLDRGERR